MLQLLGFDATSNPHASIEETMRMPLIPHHTSGIPKVFEDFSLIIATLILCILMTLRWLAR